MILFEYRKKRLKGEKPMKNKIKNIIGITIILSTIIFCSNTYATNTTNSSNTSTNSKTNSSSNSTSNKTNKTNTSSNTTSGSSTKSSDATLSDLGIKPNDFKGFKSGTTSYKTTVPEDVAEVEVYAKTTSSKATVTGTGKKKLENGTNKVEVIVTAENGQEKIQQNRQIHMCFIRIMEVCIICQSNAIILILV